MTDCNHEIVIFRKLLYDTLGRLWLLLCVLAIVPPFCRMDNAYSCGLWTTAAILLVVRFYLVRKHNQVAGHSVLEIFMRAVTFCAIVSAAIQFLVG